mgnify:CR=1 FL=1
MSIRKRNRYSSFETISYLSNAADHISGPRSSFFERTSFLSCAIQVLRPFLRPLAVHPAGPLAKLHQPLPHLRRRPNDQMAWRDQRRCSKPRQYHEAGGLQASRNLLLQKHPLAMCHQKTLEKTFEKSWNFSIFFRLYGVFVSYRTIVVEQEPAQSQWQSKV